MKDKDVQKALEDVMQSRIKEIAEAEVTKFRNDVRPALNYLVALMKEYEALGFTRDEAWDLSVRLMKTSIELSNEIGKKGGKKHGKRRNKE